MVAVSPRPRSSVDHRGIDSSPSAGPEIFEGWLLVAVYRRNHGNTLIANSRTILLREETTLPFAPIRLCPSLPDGLHRMARLDGVSKEPTLSLSKGRHPFGGP